MAVPYPLNRDDVPKAAWDVLYEMETFVFAAADVLPEGKERRYLLESRLLHTRNILDFFSGKRTVRSNKEEDDIIAEDFGFPAPEGVLLAEPYVTRLNKFLAHITYERVRQTEREKLWPFEDTVVPLLAPCRDFASYLLTSDYLLSGNPKTREKAEDLIGLIDGLMLKIRAGE